VQGVVTEGVVVLSVPDSRDAVSGGLLALMAAFAHSWQLFQLGHVDTGEFHYVGAGA
jgi:molybdopterin biosynthesis enzyme MoaB